MKVDVAIIGSGPGGAGAALGLATTGLRVAVLEKKSLPRHKPCGGAMPPSMRQEIDFDISHLEESSVDQIQNLLNHGQRHVSQRGAMQILMVSRHRFDLALLEEAIRRGRGRVSVQEGFAVTSVEESPRTVRLRSASGESVQARYLIVADGALGKTARQLGRMKSRRFAAAMEAEVVVHPEILERERSRATFNFFCLPHGYGWVFPKRNYLSCGVGSWRGHVELPAALDDFLGRTFPPGSILQQRRFGHPIPIYRGEQQIATPRSCIVGDAAALVDPIMGEGIRYAFQSGSMAASVVARCCGAEEGLPAESSNHPPDCRLYQRMAHDKIGRELNALQGFVSPLYLEAPELFYRRFILEGFSYTTLARRLAETLQQRIEGGDTANPQTSAGGTLS